MFWKRSFDERFVRHRLYATRFSAVVTAVFVAAWLLYEAIINDVVRQNLMLILIVLAVSKVAAMLYYRLTD
ncbi:MAG: hypothetical protein GY796_06305 [Chloroflexi bacterium]|nr:hypothetical protein [Chloroflexota bacterium]